MLIYDLLGVIKLIISDFTLHLITISVVPWDQACLIKIQGAQLL